MPGPKMGPRPPDFDEEVIRHSPTFKKWMSLQEGEKLRYACREFTKGHGDDEERLMRRIMIARRNNIRDHETLKKARRQTRVKQGEVPVVAASVANEEEKYKRRPPTIVSDQDVEKEMDVAAVEATRSYRSWTALSDGQEFVYNQKYTKGREGHDWLLRKNIWRRMRYRRENKKMIDRFKDTSSPTLVEATLPSENYQRPTTRQQAAASHIVDQALLPDTVVKADTSEHDVDQAAVEAAVAVAETFGTAEGARGSVVPVPSPLESAALDAAAKLAAATTAGQASGLKEEVVPSDLAEVVDV